MSDSIIDTRRISAGQRDGESIRTARYICHREERRVVALLTAAQNAPDAEASARARAMMAEVDVSADGTNR